MKRLMLSLLLLSEVSFAHGFMPDNDLYKEDDFFRDKTDMQQDEFDKAIEQVAEFYAPVVKTAHGADLVFVNKWEDPTVNAYATQIGKRWEVHMFGGLARRPEITVDGFQLVACHEVGHHLGGFPFVATWAANEGQSDYFSTLACARNLWKNELLKNAESAKTIAAYPKKLCDAAWKNSGERNLCYRIAQAGKSLGALLSGGTARYETPDRRVVTRTNNEHPAGQCRLDTYVAGATCTAKFNSAVIPKTESDSARYSCERPRCWFKPAPKTGIFY